jgi:uncharacterized protein (TIGR03435 family)
MTQLASSLSPFVRRFTVDKTGLPGRFDVELTWTPEQAPPSAVTTVAPDAARSDSPGPSLFTALQEQLGLKLVAERGPVDVLIIDHVEKASGN